MRILNFLSATPFVPCHLMAAPVEGFGGPASTATAPPSWAPPSAAPEATGDTLESKLASAATHIKSLFANLGLALSAFTAIQTDHKTLEGQFNSLKETAQLEKDEHGKTKGLLETEKTNHTATSGKLVSAESNVTRLETLCGLKGIDPNQAIAAQPEAKDSSGSGLYAQYEDLRKEEASGKVASGTAMAFYREHKSELRKFAATQRK